MLKQSARARSEAQRAEQPRREDSLCELDHVTKQFRKCFDVRVLFFRAADWAAAQRARGNALWVGERHAYTLWKASDQFTKQCLIRLSCEAHRQGQF